jgi:hypothetical protein
MCGPNAASLSSARAHPHDFDWQFALIRKPLMEEPGAPRRIPPGSDHALQRVIAFGLWHGKQIISDLDSQAKPVRRSPIITGEMIDGCFYELSG